MRVVAFVPDGVATLALGFATAIFRARVEQHDMDIRFCTERPGEVRTDAGLAVAVSSGMRLIGTAGEGDLVLVLPGTRPDTTPPALVRALRRGHDRGAIVAAHCVAVFALADTGLLDGLSATTHWQYAEDLRAQHPRVDVRPADLYVDEGRIVTGAGAAAGVDLYLHLVRRELGASLANTLARLIVVAPHRAGDQAQFVAAPVPGDGDDGRLADVLKWARTNLADSPTVDDLAARALMSRRSFVRHFTAATGTAPHRWLVHQRLLRAEELLETTDLPIENVAREVGFGNAALLRERFVARRGVTPRDYRRTFRSPDQSARV